MCCARPRERSRTVGSEKQGQGPKGQRSLNWGVFLPGFLLISLLAAAKALLLVYSALASDSSRRSSTTPRSEVPCLALSAEEELKISLRFALSPTATAPKRSQRTPAPLARADACEGAPRRGSTRRRSAEIAPPTPKRAERCLQNRPWACRTNNGFQTFKGRLTRRYLYAWVPPIMEMRMET